MNYLFFSSSFTENKSFFVTSKSLYRYGDGWRRKKEEMQRAGESEQGSQLCAFIGIGNSDQDMQQLDLNGKVVIKFIGNVVYIIFFLIFCFLFVILINIISIIIIIKIIMISIIVITVIIFSITVPPRPCLFLIATKENIFSSL